jgi:hypothetical protein
LAPNADARPGLTVNVTTLDQEFPAETIDVMKLDVEGHEAAVLAGGQKLFSSHRVRHLIFEAHDGPQSPVCQQMLSWGYQLQRIGWTLTKPIMVPLAAPPIHKYYESPSYIALGKLAARAIRLERCCFCFPYGNFFPLEAHTASVLKRTLDFASPKITSTSRIEA